MPKYQWVLKASENINEIKTIY